jgi:hypothetical protein
MNSQFKLKLDWCSYEAAKYAVEHWHYSKCLPKFKQNWIGVWENLKFIGVISFGRSSTPYLGTAYNLTTFECAELTRIALKKHETPVSKIIAIAVKMVKKKSPGMRLFVSLADPSQNHVGAVYQASGWKYIGKSSCMRQYFFKGKWRNDSSLMREIQKFPLLKKTLKSKKIQGKYKYVLALDKEMAAIINPLAKPYPKRAEGETKDTLAIHAREGGSLPTSALHISSEVKNG